MRNVAACRSSALAWLALGLVLSRSGTAQEIEPFSETIEVQVVNVEVIVTDRQGEPVTGLTREDFEVYEDGRQVELTNFFAVEGRSTVLAPGETEEDSLPAPATRNLSLVVFIDNLNTRPENRNLIFGNLEEYLRANLDPRDRVMLVAMGGVVEVIEAFTNDVDQLKESLDRMSKEVGQHVRDEVDHRTLLRRMQQARMPPSPAQGGPILDLGGLRDFEDAQVEAIRLANDIRFLAERRYRKVQVATEALAHFTDTLAGLRGRKAVLYVSDGLALRAADSMAQGWLNKFEAWAAAQDAAAALGALRDMETLALSSELDAGDLFDRLVTHASNNGVAFYTISNSSRASPRGVSAEFGAPGTAHGQGPMSPDVVALETQSLESSLLRMAGGTGGLTFTGTANVAGLLDRMIGDFETFYSLGYSPPAGRDGQPHRVEVKVKRGGLDARHLGSYRLKDPLAELQDRTLSALHYGIVDNGFAMRLDPGRQVRSGRKSYQVPIWLKIPFHKLVLLPQEGFHVAQLSVFVVARDLKGGVSPFQQIQLPIRVPDADLEQAMMSAATYPIQLEMQQGWQRVSVGVRDHLGRLDATANVDLEVGAR